MNAEQTEDLRHVAARCLADRYPAALSIRQISRAIAKESEVKFEEDDLRGALELLCDLKFCDKKNDALGSTIYWRATPELVLKCERGEMY